jgi:hypothetical protein
MFLGESLCLIPYFIMRWRRRKAKRLDPAYVPMPAHEKRSRRWGRIMAFAVPTLCDATGTSLMNIGLCDATGTSLMNIGLCDATGTSLMNIGLLYTQAAAAAGGKGSSSCSGS